MAHVLRTHFFTALSYCLISGTCSSATVVLRIRPSSINVDLNTSNSLSMNNVLINIYSFVDTILCYGGLLTKYTLSDTPHFWLWWTSKFCQVYQERDLVDKREINRHFDCLHFLSYLFRDGHIIEHHCFRLLSYCFAGGIWRRAQPLCDNFLYQW